MGVYAYRLTGPRGLEASPSYVVWDHACPTTRAFLTRLELEQVTPSLAGKHDQNWEAWVVGARTCAKKLSERLEPIQLIPNPVIHVLRFPSCSDRMGLLSRLISEANRVRECPTHNRRASERQRNDFIIYSACADALGPVRGLANCRIHVAAPPY